MKKRSDSGIRIEKRTEAGEKGWQAPLRQGAASLLLFFALGTAAVSAFMPDGVGSVLPAALTGCAVCVLSALRDGLPWKKYIQLGVFVLLLLSAVIFFRRAADGLCLCWNSWCERRTAVTGVLRLGLSVSAAPEEQSGCVTFFLTLTGAVLAVFCSWSARHARVAGASVCLLAAAALAVLLRASVSVLAVFLPLAVCVLLLTAPTQTSGGAARLSGGAAVALLTALVLLVLMQVPGVRDGSFFAALHADAERALHVRRYEPQAQPLPEGDLSALGAKKSTGRVMLRVQMDRAEPMYLRGFTGEVYTQSGWQAISAQALAEQSGLLYWLHSGGFYPQTQAGLAARVVTDGEPDTNAAACSRYIYAPYMAMPDSFPQPLTQTRLEAASILSGSGADRAQSYRTVYAAPEKTAQWVAALQAAQTEPQTAYLTLEAGYRQLVNDWDLTLSDAVRQMLAPYLDPIAEAHADEPMTALLAVRCTREFLESALTYGENTAVLPENTDLAAFTLQNGTGCDFQYATLAVLALRYYGLPARYAEGYVVTQELADDAASGGAELTDENAHAWAEVYQEGVGWLPLEMTPGYADAMGSAQQAGELAAGIGDRTDAESTVGTMAGDGKGTFISEGASYDPQPEQDASADDTDDAPDQSNAPRTRFTRLLLWLLPLLVLAALCAALALRRRSVLKKRQAQFGDENSQNAAAWRFAYCARLLEHLGFRRAGGSVLAMTDRLAEGCGAEYAAQFRRMALVNQQALFSAHMLESAQSTEMEEFTQSTLRLLREKTPFIRRLRQKWLLCLY